MNWPLFVVALVVLFVLSFSGWRVYLAFIKAFNMAVIRMGFDELCWAYEGVALDKDDEIMFAFLEELLGGKIDTQFDSGKNFGSFFVEGAGQMLFLVPRGRPVWVDVPPGLMPSYLAAELGDFYAYRQGMNELEQSLLHHEWGIKTFCLLKQKGYEFMADAELLEEWFEEAAIYSADRQAWTVRTRAFIFQEYPHLIPLGVTS